MGDRLITIWHCLYFGIGFAFPMPIAVDSQALFPEYWTVLIPDQYFV